MQQAHSKRTGQRAGRPRAQQQAAQALDQAAQQLAQAASTRPATGNKQDSRPAKPCSRRRARWTGQGRMQQGKPQGAQESMAQAAQALAQAAQQAASRPIAGQAGDPNGIRARSGAAAGGRPDTSLFAPETKQYAGKPWGELPGELRTKIVQQMKAKYGDDYARMIKLYFEQAADTQ